MVQTAHAWSVPVAAHAAAASLALVLGGANLVRRPKGNRPHRAIGWVWVGLMYFTALSSFLGQMIRAGNFSWIHELSVLTLALWRARHGDVRGRATAPTDDELETTTRDVTAVHEQLQADGAWVFGGGLHDPSTATVVDARGGRVATTDGPFPEAKEQLGGVWIIDVADLDAALDWAQQATVACRGPVEVRPFQPEPDDA